NPAGSLVKFLFTKGQEYEADLFVVHLCRNAAFRVNRGLDFLRLLCLMSRPTLLTQADAKPGESVVPETLGYYLSTHPDPFLRHKRLLLELLGQPENSN